MQTAIQLAGPIATVIAALTAGGIAIWLGRAQVTTARLQAKTANDKIVLDLFDRRLKIYSDARAVIGRTTGSGQCSNEEQFNFLKAIDGASFLFGTDVTDYFNKLYHDLIDLDACNKEAEHIEVGEKRAEIFQKRRKHFEAIQEFYTKAPTLLAPYLSAHQTFAKQAQRQAQRYLHPSFRDAPLGAGPESMATGIWLDGHGFRVRAKARAPE